MIERLEHQRELTDWDLLWKAEDGSQLNLDRLAAIFRSLKDGEEIGLFYTKPYLTGEQQQLVYDYENLKTVISPETRKAEFYVPQSDLTKEFWFDFYDNVLEEFPEVARRMANDFSREDGYGIKVNIVRGINAAKNVRATRGKTKFADNPPDTLIGKFFYLGNPKGLQHRTVAHASRTTEEGYKDLLVFEKHGILPSDLSSLINA